jgi:protein TonB
MASIHLPTTGSTANPRRTTNKLGTMRSVGWTLEFAQEAAAPATGDANFVEGKPSSAHIDSPPIEAGRTPHKRWPLQFSLSIALSLLVHVSVLIWHLIELPSPKGLAGQELEAIGVEIVDASALESISAERDHGSTASAASVVTEAGTAAPVTQSEVAPADLAPTRTDESTPPTAAFETEVQTNAEVTAAEVVRDNLEQRPPSPPLREPLPKPDTEREPEIGRASDAVAQVEQHATVAGGATSTSAQASTGGNAAAGASPGQLARFAMQVRGALGRSRPRHLGARGNVDVSFVLSIDGQLVSAAIVRSSSNPRIDEMALAAVRTAAYPRPPERATESQRTFIVPFNFK